MRRAVRFSWLERFLPFSCKLRIARQVRPGMSLLTYAIPRRYVALRTDRGGITTKNTRFVGVYGPHVADETRPYEQAQVVFLARNGVVVGAMNHPQLVRRTHCGFGNATTMSEISDLMGRPVVCRLYLAGDNTGRVVHDEDGDAVRWPRRWRKLCRDAVRELNQALHELETTGRIRGCCEPAPPVAFILAMSN